MTCGILNADLMNILSWRNPWVSAVYLIFLNISLWILHRQRPLCGLALVVLVYFVRRLWKNRIRSEVLVDPPDQEEWVSLSMYDLEKSTFDLSKSIFTSWVELRRQHYLMWLTLTSVFWIVLAKVASYISFLAMLVVISNGSFVAGSLIKRFGFELRRETNFELAEHVLTTSLADAAEDLNSDALVPEAVKRESESESRSGLKGAVKKSSKESKSAVEFSESYEPSNTPPPEPESLTPYGVTIPSHEDSSEDEFLFDPKHFESSSSSASNSFELLHF